MLGCAYQSTQTKSQPHQSGSFILTDYGRWRNVSTSPSTSKTPQRWPLHYFNRSSLFTIFPNIPFKGWPVTTVLYPPRPWGIIPFFNFTPTTPSYFLSIPISYTSSLSYTITFPFVYFHNTNYQYLEQQAYHPLYSMSWMNISNMFCLGLPLPYPIYPLGSVAIIPWFPLI